MQIFLTVILTALSRVMRALPWQIWAALGVLVFSGIMAWQIDARAYNRGFAAADEAWVERVEQELERQDEANREAMRRAQEEIARLQEGRRVRDATIERLLGEAAQDPDADRPAIGTDSVRRLNSVLD